MIKKLQALKAKKGFTLVELVVVIAIIGVLAAILVPTMMGVVQDSRITSANSTAQQVKDRTTEFLTKMDAAKASYKADAGTNNQITLTVVNGKWTLSGGHTTSDWLDDKDHWGSTFENATASEEELKKKDTEYVAYIGDSLSDLKSAYIEVNIKNGKVVGVVSVDGATSGDNVGELPKDEDFQKGYFGWNNKAGINDSNIVVGTSPVLTLEPEE